MKRGKNYIKASDGINKALIYSIDDVLSNIKKTAYAKFDETIDIDVNVGIDPSKGDQVVRGSVVLPHGRGKKVRVIVFAKGEHIAQAENAGADHVGLEDLIDKISAGWMDFEYAVATPDVMGIVGKLAKQLGPRGLLPNKKVGTVTFDVAQVVKELKSGRVFFKNDKNAVIHFSVGKRSFDANSLKDNIQVFFKALLSSKPSSSKGKFLRKATVSSTMGIGFSVNIDELLK